MSERDRPTNDRDQHFTRSPGYGHYQYAPLPPPTRTHQPRYPHQLSDHENRAVHQPAGYAIDLHQVIVRKRRIWPRVLVGAVLLVLGGSGVLLAVVADDLPESEPTITSETVEAAGEVATDDAGLTSFASVEAESVTFGGAAVFGEGTFIVGDEIQPGIYRAEGGDFCYWERMAGFSGDFDEIIANGNGPAATVEIIAGDEGFTSTSCGDWRPVDQTHPAEPATTFEDGTWVVGADIAPGTYRSNGAGEFCYWERLNGFSGEFDDIIANNNGVTTVEISDTDTGFASTDCGNWTPMG